MILRASIVRVQRFAGDADLDLIVQDITDEQLDALCRIAQSEKVILTIEPAATPGSMAEYIMTTNYPCGHSIAYHHAEDWDTFANCPGWPK